MRRAAIQSSATLAEKPLGAGCFLLVRLQLQSAQFFDVALFVNRLTVFVGITGSEIHGTMADSAAGKIRQGDEGNISVRHGGPTIYRGASALRL